MAKVCSFFPHHGEEECLSGNHGSGTIFFSGCNLHCVFCQNFDISHENEGDEVSAEILAGMMLELQKSHCHNINLVTPSHFVPQIIESLVIAAEKGLNLPVVYNTSGYDSVETISLLDGIVDIYMPDLKFFDSRAAQKFCNAPDYPDCARKSIKLMHSQVGDLLFDENGIAQRGLLVRHLVMPSNLASTSDAMKFLAEEISTDTFVNLMTQYRPCGQALKYPELSRRPFPSEFRDALEAVISSGIQRLDKI
jgi:putative pyruvate formate lyase activating enzyme